MYQVKMFSKYKCREYSKTFQPWVRYLRHNSKF